MKPRQWEWDAEEYSRHSSAQYEWAKELIGQLRLRGDESVLDIGCGDGRVTEAIAAQLPRGTVVGMDNSEDMLMKARAAFPAKRHPNMTFLQGDVLLMDLPERFDIAFSNATLHWIRDHRTVLRRVHDSLKAGGRILFQMGGKGNAAEVAAILDAMIIDERWARYFGEFQFPYSFYTPEEYAPWLAGAGFAATRVELLTKDMAQKGGEGLSGWVRTTWLPYTQRIPQALREEFIADLVGKYIRLHGIDGDGLVHVKMVRLEVEATKP